MGLVEDIIEDVRLTFHVIKPYLYYDIDIDDSEITWDQDTYDVTIDHPHVAKFCAKFDDGKFYGPVLIEHHSNSYEEDDYQFSELDEYSFITGTFWENKAVGVWTYASRVEDNDAQPEYMILAKVKYDDNGNVKKTKIWEPWENVVDGTKMKPVVKVKGYHALNQIFILS